MIRQPPDQVPSEIAVAAEKITHSGKVVAGDDVAAGEQRQEDHAHRLLRVLEAVAERHGRGRARSAPS